MVSRRFAAPLLALLVGVPVAAAGCSSSASTSVPPGAVRVVAAENFWGDVARQIGGDHVSVTSIISDPEADPHQFESDAHDVVAVARARVVIVNGAGYDGFVSSLLSSTTNAGRVVVTVARVLRVGDDVNPHLWYDVPHVPLVAAAIENELAAADPAHAAAFAANLTTFDASIVTLEQLITRIKTRYPGAPVAYTERVPGYLLDAAGLTVVSPSGFARAIEDGNEPSAGDTKAMEDLFTNHRVRVLLYNAQATSAVTQHVQDLARRSGIPVVAVTETMPKNEPTYQSWQQHQLEALLRALGG